MQITSSAKIQLLPENIIDQIKAGEVIERPATLLKELLENSLDAGATKIKITIENNGLDLIYVQDNGNGISFDDLPLAFYRHATSKIHKFEDLYNLFSYGFRGEALASMASVSKITCSSSNSFESSVLKIEGGEIISQQRSEYHDPQTGTEIFVKDLFYNTPVRLKFVGTKTSEKNQLKKMIASFILTRPDVEFSVKMDDSQRKIYPIVSNFSDRINDLLFPKSKQEFYVNTKSYDDIEVTVHLSKSSARGYAGKQQFIFVNDRFIQDTTIHKIVCNSATQLWPHGQVGHYLIFIKTEPHMVDVNVHPNKINVKFYMPNKVQALVSQTVKDIRHQYPEETIDSNTGEILNSDHSTFIPSQQTESTLSNFDYQGTKFEHLQNVPKSQNTTFDHLSLTNRFAVHSIEDQLYIIDLLALAVYQIETFSSETPITPLMVSEPIRNMPNIGLKEMNALSQKGFDLDKLGAETILLKGHPSLLEAFNCSVLVETLLKAVNLNGVLSYESIYEQLKGFQLSNPLVNSSYDLQKLIFSIPFNVAINKKIAVKLEDKTLIKLFYE